MEQGAGHKRRAHLARLTPVTMESKKISVCICTEKSSMSTGAASGIQSSVGVEQRGAGQEEAAQRRNNHDQGSSVKAADSNIHRDDLKNKLPDC